MQDGRTALCIACWDGKIDTVKLLLRLKAKSDIQDEVHCIPVVFYVVAISMLAILSIQIIIMAMLIIIIH